VEKIFVVVCIGNLKKKHRKAMEKVVMMPDRPSVSFWVGVYVLLFFHIFKEYVNLYLDYEIEKNKIKTPKIP